MAFSSLRAETRFGYGVSPHVAAPRYVTDMLDGVSGPDQAAQTFSIPLYDAFTLHMQQDRAFAKALKEAGGTPQAAEIYQKRMLHRRQVSAAQRDWSINSLLRRATTPQGFRERLVAFWADHFTVIGKNRLQRASVLPYIEEAIRPNLAGSFAQLLQAVITHPVMLGYLDQARSMGEKSRAASRRTTPRGLNENLARELLELHTLGVDGPYTQADVRQLAKLLTGLSVNRERKFEFRPAMVEPGAETVLGTQYTGRGMRPIRMMLEDLAVHPVTAQHIARKLAVHFVSDHPEPGLVAHIAAQWMASGGDLMAVYGALLEHPDAWAAPAQNVKPPVDFVVSGLRALGVTAADVNRLTPRRRVAALIAPLALMGQPWGLPLGPDGWPEEDSVWITPQGLAARLRWALAVPEQVARSLPDPRDFVETALGGPPPEPVRFAAAAAESRAEAIGLVLASPAFQRR